MTLESCASFCSGYTYFGTEYANECYCGNSIVGSNTVTTTTSCSTTCAGNTTEYCGGGNLLTVYVLNGTVASSSSTSSTSSTTSGSSTSGTGTSTSTSATSTASAVSCPASNSTTYTAPNGDQFVIECGIDHVGGDLGVNTTNTFQDCINACSTISGCVDVSLSGVACYLKSTLTSGSANANIYGARLVTGSSPSTVGGVISTTSSSSSSSTGTTSSTTSSTTGSTSSSSTTDISSTSSTGSSSSSSTVSSSDTTTTSSSSSSTSGSSSSSTVSPSSSSTSSSSVSSASSSSSSSTASSMGSTTTSSTSSTSSPSSSSTTTSSSSSASTTTTSSSSTSSSASPSATLPVGIASQGCYVDTNSRVLPNLAYANSSNTPSFCASTCRSKGFKYAGTEYGNECYCGNDLEASTAQSTDCNMACAGDSTQKCGAGYRLSVTVDNNWVQTFFAVQNYNTWNLMACYVDSVSSRILSHSVSTPGGSSNATINNCLDACAAKGYTYCGAEYYSECFGSTTTPNASAVATSSTGSTDPLKAGCTYACTGNATESCGGSNRIIVYTNNGTST
ncbi:WSC-domain-containing protein [Viridothelium virens]|uniref:WSC-domain-containing protein n=1 Tax=Viridothelium virens TaxID=1048519 RepID=A0A6A6HML5_VIRVR|nr:WSC-domain-containing protein [Viridothelium virens]